MNHLYACSNLSPKCLIAEQGRPIHSVLNTCQSEKAINCSQRVSASKIINRKSINNRNCKLFKRCCCIPVKLQDDIFASKSDEEDHAKSLQEILCKKLNVLYRHIRPDAVLAHIIGITSVCLLPIVNITDLNPTFFKELLKAVVPTVLMTIYVVSLNQVYDLEIDKINKPDRPLASGDLSMGAAITIVSTSLLMSLAMGIMFKSPPQIIALLIHALLGTAYSADLPFLRWKKNAFLAASGIVIQMGITVPLFFIHTQKYVLGRPIEITKSLIFATAFISFFASILALQKDIPDVDGDREHGIQTLSISLGKERVFWLSVQLLLMAYGAAVIFGFSSSFLSSKLVTVLGHSMLAYSLWLRARSTDLSSHASTSSFYSFLWKLLCAEYLLLPFVR